MLFETFCQLGFQHIADLNAMDHILFLVALCAIYELRDWKKILVLVTAFTIGHSLTLALAVMNIFVPNAAFIEFLIPLTIFFTSIYNIFDKKIEKNTYIRINYAFALLFGLIHGLGFSNYLRSLLSGDGNLWQPLLSFNIGLELGQLLIVSTIMLLCFLALKIIPQRAWALSLSAIAAVASLTMLFERWPF
jgi:hypothetical protein